MNKLELNGETLFLVGLGFLIFCIIFGMTMGITAYNIAQIGYH